MSAQFGKVFDYLLTIVIMMVVAANKLLGRGVGLDGRKKMIRASISKINHWVLFKQLTASRVPVYLVKVLCHCYQNQSMYEGSTLSERFNVTNSDRQQGSFIPYSF